ncbi:RHS repeat-associated core domain-containing protein, partial [Enterobacter mori]|uniref:RHS repeat-associated core domain-containing protein n=1 Tax=Enterobacter mori TaxID=539813 RepID=UPI002FD6ECD7
YIYDPNEAWSPLARVDHLRDQSSGEIYWFNTDLNGAPLEVTDERGAVRWSGQYGSFGEVRHQSEGFSRAVNRTAMAHQPLRYAGQYADGETGLHYNLFRYYDPQVGRFIVQDPIGLNGGLNTYAYAPNPHKYIDPLGLCKGDVVRGNNPYQTRVDPRFPGRPDPAFSIDTRTFESGTLTSKGGIRNNQEFWSQWADMQPGSLSNSNLYRIKELGLSPKIDDTWIKAFPEHVNYKGDTIIHHHVDFGPYAIPVPGSTHVGSGGVWHTK